MEDFKDNIIGEDTEDAIFGYTGFVGTNLCLQYPSIRLLYNSKNLSSARNKRFRNVICCCLPAKKWYANENPEEDWKGIEGIKDIIKTIYCERFILISTIDVFSDTSLQHTEISDLGWSEEPYGKHRREFEMFIQTVFRDKFLIIRLPALFGLFLKKNIIFDFLSNPKRQLVALNNRYQWYYIKNLRNDIETCFKQNITLVHLFSENIPVYELLHFLYAFAREYHCDYRWKLSSHTLDYNTSNIKIYDCSSIYPHFLKSRKVIFRELSNYLLRHEVWERLIAMPFCIKDYKDEFSKTVWDQFGIENLEAAPYSFLGKEWLSIKLENPKVKRLHGIMYPHSWNIWTDFQQTEELFHSISKYCKSYPQIKGITFGSPKNRNVTSDIYPYEIGVVMRHYNSLFNLSFDWENNSSCWGTNIMDSIESFHQVITQVGNGMTITLDTDNCRLMNFDPILFYDQFKSNIRHIHLSRFKNKNEITLWEENEEFITHVLKNQYAGYIAVELLCNSQTSIHEYLHNIYI
jgi:hypothetical protein